MRHLRPPDRDRAFDDAFPELFLRARRLAYRVVGDWAVAEDVAAEALARACYHWPKIKDLAWRDGWVLRVTTNVAIDVVRRRRPNVVVAPVPDSDEATTLRLALVDALRRLPQRQREVVALRYLSDLTEADVAAALGISLSSVKKHTSRALASLRGRLGNDVEGIDLVLN